MRRSILRENAMIKSISRFFFVCTPLCLLAQANGAINGFVSSPRVFNDIPTSTLVIVNPGTNPDTASINDSNFGTATTGANRSDILASSNGGATAASLNINQGFTISTTLTLSAGTNSPRKEAGIRINAPVTGDALFLVNTDAGEIVAFGGGAPFHLFGNNAGGNGYVPGTPITISERYDPPGTANATKGLITYSVNYPTHPSANGSFSDLFSNLEGGPGPSAYSFGVYEQAGPANPTDFVNASFANLTASQVPEPASFTVIALGGLSLLTRRRRAR
jgi:hypothetical protein